MTQRRRFLLMLPLTAALGGLIHTGLGWLGWIGPPTTVQAPACPLPSPSAGLDGTVQSEVPAGLVQFPLSDASADVLAGFSFAARVLARKDYTDDRPARYSPIDLALGWGRMREEEVLARMRIWQFQRFYYYSWKQPSPLLPNEAARSSSNMHLIPADASIHAALDAIDVDDAIRIDGWLVRVRADDGWRMRSSLSRDDTGAGACEVVYVCAIGSP